MTAFPTMARVSLRRHSDKPFTNVEKGVVQLDPYLEPFKDALKRRYIKAQNWIKVIDEHEGGLEKFSRVISFFDLPRSPSADSTCRVMRGMGFRLTPTAI